VLVVFVALTFGILIPSIHSFIRIYGNIMLMIDNLQFTLPTISCTIRIMIFWWKKEGRQFSIIILKYIKKNISLIHSKFIVKL